MRSDASSPETAQGAAPVSDFKPGDRVEYTGTLVRNWMGRKGTVEAQITPRTVRVAWDDGKSAGYFPESLTKLEEPKPELRVGDRVRISREGTVGESGSSWLDIEDEDGYAYTVSPERWEIELLERKAEPLKPGDRVQGSNGHWLVVDDAVWYIPEPAGMKPFKSETTPERLAGLVGRGTYSLVE